MPSRYHGCCLQKGAALRCSPARQRAKPPCRCSPHRSQRLPRGCAWHWGAARSPSASLHLSHLETCPEPQASSSGGRTGAEHQWHSGKVSGRDLQPTCLVLLLQALSHPSHPARTVSLFPPAPRLLGVAEDLRLQVGREMAAPSTDAPLYFMPWSLSSRLWLALRHPAGLGAGARTSRGAGTPGARSTAPFLRRRPSASFLLCPAQKAVKDSLALISDEAALAQLQRHSKSRHQLSCRMAPAQALSGNPWLQHQHLSSAAR